MGPDQLRPRRAGPLATAEVPADLSPCRRRVSYNLERRRTIWPCSTPAFSMIHHHCGIVLRLPSPMAWGAQCAFASNGEPSFSEKILDIGRPLGSLGSQSWSLLPGNLFKQPWPMLLKGLDRVRICALILIPALAAPLMAALDELSVANGIWGPPSRPCFGHIILPFA